MDDRKVMSAQVLPSPGAEGWGEGSRSEGQAWAEDTFPECAQLGKQCHWLHGQQFPEKLGPAQCLGDLGLLTFPKDLLSDHR